MARFDIYKNEGMSKKSTPYLIDVQSNVINALATRIVIPLRSLAGFGTVNVPQDLCPMIAVQNKQYFLDTPQLAAIPANELKKKIASAQEYQFQIQAALDRVFGGY